MSLLSICTVCTSGEKRLTERRQNALAKLASKLQKLLANSKFHSHLASWRVVIFTPGVCVRACVYVSSAICMNKRACVFLGTRVRACVCVFVCVLSLI
jgi:hypothetical protein